MTMNTKSTLSALPRTPCSVVEVRLRGKLHDLILDGPEYAVRNALTAGGPYEEARVVENPHGYDFAFLGGLISSPNSVVIPHHDKELV